MKKIDELKRGFHQVLKDGKKKIDAYEEKFSSGMNKSKIEKLKNRKEQLLKELNNLNEIENSYKEKEKAFLEKKTRLEKKVIYKNRKKITEALIFTTVILMIYSVYIGQLGSYQDKVAEKIDAIISERRDEENRRKARQKEIQAQENEALNKRAADQFSVWDGSHRNLTKIIKEELKDPKSYEHIETRYVRNNSSITVVTRFRANNAIGLPIVNTVTARVAVDGDNIEIKSWE